MEDNARGHRAADGPIGATDHLAMERLVEKAREGDRKALEQVVEAIQADVYNLAVRMLAVPEDAEDATQEILLKVVTHLGGFRGESSFRTWTYRVAVNHLLNVRKSRIERAELSFDAFGAALEKGLGRPTQAVAPVTTAPDQALLLEELKIGCTQAMLLCLARDERIAFILAEVFRMPSEEAATVLEISAAAYRKRASRGRERLRTFMRAHCGLVEEAAPCRCERWIGTAVASGVVNPARLQYAGRGQVAAQRGADRAGEWEELDRMAAVYRGHPRYSPPETAIAAVRDLLASGKYALLH